MAVNVDDIDLIAARHVQAYKEAELQILDIIRDALDSGMDAPTWTEERLDAVVALRRASERVVQRLATGDPAIRADIALSYRNGRGGAVIDLPGDLGDAARAARRTVPQVAAMDSLAAALIRDIGERRRNVLRNVEDVYRQTQAAAVARMLAGGITRREASQAAWQGFVDQGVTSFTDRTGRTWRLTTYVEMAVRTVAMRAAVQGQVDQLLDLGRDLVVVSDEFGECPRCRPWEGKILRITPGPTGKVDVPSITGRGPVTVDIAGSLEQAMLAGLLHPNCGHAIRAYLPGATRLPSRPTEAPEGNKARERQREIERAIRKHKEREVAALTPEAKQAARSKVRAWQATMRQHLADNPDLRRLDYREQIGAGNLPPGGKAPSPAGRLHGRPPRPEPPATPSIPPGPSTPDSGGGAAAARAAKRAAARARQAEIDHRAPIAELLAEFDELLSKGADRATFLQRLNLATTTGVDKNAIASLRRALGDERKLRGAFARIEKKHGLTPIGRAGDEVAYDPDIHEALGDNPTDGQSVEIVRRGTVLDLNGETIQLERARVTLAVSPVRLVQQGDLTHLRQIGPQGGSNPGGLYEAADGSKWYVKAAQSQEHAANEALAAELYRLAGIDVPEIHIGHGAPGLPDGPQLASRIVDNAVSDLSTRLTDDAYLALVHEGFAVDAWLANWDVVGAAYDNVVTAGGRPWRIDVGGSLLFRARGGPKGTAFGDLVTEWTTLRDENYIAGEVFSKITSAELVASAERVRKITPAQIRDLVSARGLPDSLADTLIARRKDVLARQKRAQRALDFDGRVAQVRRGQDALDAAPVRLSASGSRIEPRPARWSDSEFQDNTAAVQSYRGSGYRTINEWFRTGKPAGHPGEQQAQRVQAAIASSPLPEDVVVHRGLAEGTTFGPAWSPDGDMSGAEWTESAVVSASADARVAEHFASGSTAPIVLRIIVPAGLHALRLSDFSTQTGKIFMFSVTEEAELVLEAGLRFRIVADHGVVGRTRRLDVEVVVP